MKEIIQKENEVLRKMAQDIVIDDIQSPKIKNILKEMSQALKSQDDGVAIAAPQIGYSVRIFLVSGKVFEKDFLKERDDRISGKQKIDEVAKIEKELKDLVFINPVISKLSKEKSWVPEGCLSVRWLYGKTHRSKKATVMAYNENGKKFQMGGSGLLAQIFQHETDHLNGILFIDHAKEIKEDNPDIEN